MFTKEREHIFSVSEVETNAAFSRLLIDSFVAAFRILMNYKGTIFLI